MTVRLLLCRHGAHDEIGRVLSGRSEIALNAAGQAQAVALAAHLADERIASVISSPRRRTIETAAPIAIAASVAVRSDARLDEIDFGRFAGRGFADLDRDVDWARWNAERDDFRCPGGETMAEAVDRAWRFLLSLEEQERAVVVVTHCDVIRGVVAALLGLPFSRLFALPCDPGSLTELALTGGELRLVTLNARP